MVNLSVFVARRCAPLGVASGQRHPDFPELPVIDYDRQRDENCVTARIASWC